MKTLSHILEHLYRMTMIPTRCFDSSGEEILFSCGYEAARDPLFGDSVKKLIFTTQSKNSPFIRIEEKSLAYGYFADTTECHVVLGPITAFSMTSSDIQDFKMQNHTSSHDSLLIHRNLQELTSYITLLHFQRFNKILEDIKVFNKRSEDEKEHERNKYTFFNTDEDISRLGYESERKFVEQIKNGEIMEVEKSISDQLVKRNHENFIGMLAKKPHKHFEYMVCTSICLASRASIDGGVSPTTAYAMSDLFLQRLEKCKEILDFLYLHDEMRLDFTMAVNKIKKDRSDVSYIEKTKIYIQYNLNKRFTLDDISSTISINKHYLSRIFVQNTKLTIMEYTRKERIKAAANMLKFSDDSISSIATYLTFPNQSHFGKVFKEIIGLSPKQYRLKNQIIEIKPEKNAT